MALIKTLHLVNLSTGDTYDAAVLNIWDSAEISVTIIAASVPSLRVFLRDIVSSASGKYYAQPDGGISSNPQSNNYQYSVQVRSRNRYPLGNQNAGSDESILDTNVNGKIVRVDEIAVKHGDGTDNEGENTFEMHSVK